MGLALAGQRGPRRDEPAYRPGHALVYAAPQTKTKRRGPKSGSVRWSNRQTKSWREPASRSARATSWRATLGCGYPWAGGKEYFRDLISKPDADVLVWAAVLFDLRGLYGDMSLVEELENDILESLEGTRSFCRTWCKTPSGAVRRSRSSGASCSNARASTGTPSTSSAGA